MAAPSPDRIRTVALVGHSHDGKTSLGESLLHVAGATARLGATDQHSSILDHEPEEHRRSMSISAAVAHLDWQGHRINVIDVPGFQDFAGEMATALAVADAAVLVVAATGVVPVGAELAWRALSERGLATLIVVNKMDKENAAYEPTVDALREAFDRKPIAVAVPIGRAGDFRGYVDLVNDSAHVFEGGGQVRDAALPEDMRAEVERAHGALVDAAAETDDALIEKYLGGTDLTDEEVRRAVHAAALRGTLAPTICAAAGDERGAALVLDSIVQYLPGPAEQVHRGRDADGDEVVIACDPGGRLVAHVFKTTVDSFGKVSYFKVLSGTVNAHTRPYDVQQDVEERFAQLGRPMGKLVEGATEVAAGDIGVVTKLPHARTGDALGVRGTVVTLPPLDLPAPAYRAAISARAKGDEDKIMTALARLTDEDPALRVDRDDVTAEVLIHGLGDVHLDVALERLRRKFGVEAVLTPPRIPYRETITGSARVGHKHKKQSGGAGLYGDCTIEIEPLARGLGFVWEDRIVGGSIPQHFRPSVEKGVRQTLERGAVSGHPLVDIKVRLVDGSTHPVDGKDIAFQIAGAMAMREAVQSAGPVLLEPIMDVQVVVPERFTGDVMGLLNAKRGRVAGMNPRGDGTAEVAAHVPQAEMHSFPTELRALTQGRGRYSMSLGHYDELPAHLAAAIINDPERDHVHAHSPG